MRFTAARFALPAAIAIIALLALVAMVPPPATAQAVEDNETTTFTFDLRADGDTRVTVILRLPLSEDADRDAFDQLAMEHEAGDDSPLSVAPFREAAARSSQSTGRSMEIRNVDRTAGRTNETGRLELSFTWTNFTRTSSSRVFVGDSFQTPEGTWFGGLAENQDLRITLPPGYEPESIVIPQTRYRYENRTIHVDGPATFEPGSPSIVLERTGGDGGLPADLTLVGLGLGALLLLALLGYVFRAPLRDVAAGTGGADAEPAEAGAAVAAEEDDVDPELLSDEERVLRLLQTRGGRMKQVDIVQETDWSNAKVSQLLSEMEESGRVEKLRIGRENLISLPGQGPASGAGEFD